MAFDTLKLDKGLYTSGKGFTQALEQADPSEQYRGTALEGLDAYERQLKRFGIRVSGANSDRVEKFFQNSDAAVLFPEYAARAVQKGMEEADKVSGIVAATTQIEGLDYRSLKCSDVPGSNDIAEGMSLPNAEVRTKSDLTMMYKHGRLLKAPYETMRYHRLDLFTVLLRKIGSDIAREQLGDAVYVLIEGDDAYTAAPEVNKAGSTLAYSDLLNLWNSFEGFRMTSMLAGNDMVRQILALPEMRDGAAGLDFHGSGRLGTPLGAELIKAPEVQDGRILALDKSCALEKVTAGEVITDYDRMIDKQFHYASIAAIAGFSKIFAGAACLLV